MIKTFYYSDLGDTTWEEFDEEVNTYLKQLKEKSTEYELKINNTCGRVHFHHTVTVITK
jgi:hypothetical protein